MYGEIIAIPIVTRIALPERSRLPKSTMTQKDVLQAPSTASSNTFSLTSSSGGGLACAAVQANDEEVLPRINPVKTPPPSGGRGDDLPNEEVKRSIHTTVGCATPQRYLTQMNLEKGKGYRAKVDQGHLGPDRVRRLR